MALLNPFIVCVLWLHDSWGVSSKYCILSSGFLVSTREITLSFLLLWNYICHTWYGQRPLFLIFWWVEKVWVKAVSHYCSWFHVTSRFCDRPKDNFCSDYWDKFMNGNLGPPVFAQFGVIAMLVVLPTVLRYLLLSS